MHGVQKNMIQFKAMEDESVTYTKEVAVPVKHIFKDMLKYAPSKLFGLLGNAVIVPVYTNLLSPSQYGVYAISLAVLSFLCIIFSDWIGMSGLRFFRQNQLSEKIPNYISTLVFVLVTNLLSMYGLCFVFRNKFYEYFSISPKIFLFILVLIIPVAIRALLFQVLRAQIQPGAFTVSTIINQILTILLAVGIIKFYNFGAVSILIAMAVSISLIDILLIAQTKILKYLKPEKPNKDMLKSVYWYGVPIAAASLSIWVINQSNKFITTHYHGLEDAGFVGVAYNLTFPILMTLFSIITIAAFPRIINLYEDNIDVRPIISKLTGYFVLISLPIVVLISLYAKDITVVFANSQYVDAYILLPYFAFSAFFLSFTDFTTYQYHLANKTIVLTLLKVVSAVLGLVLNIFLIKNLGLLGAGIALLVSNLFYFVLTLLVKMPNLEWRVPYKEFLHLFLCFVPTIFLWVLLAKSTILPLLQINILLITYYSFYYSTRRYFKDFGV